MGRGTARLLSGSPEGGPDMDSARGNLWMRRIDTLFTACYAVRFLAFAAWLNRKPSTAAKEASVIAARLRAKRQLCSVGKSERLAPIGTRPS